MLRRSLLKLAAGGAAGMLAGVGWRAYDQGVFSAGEGPAYSAWHTWTQASPTPQHRLVRAAILAANPHNSQPWRFLVSEDAIDVYADRTRNLGSIDPDLREMHIGLGCAVENLLLAASASELRGDLSLLPDAADPTHVARVRLNAQRGEPSALYRAIPLRHTNRGAYQAKSIDAGLLTELEQLGKDLRSVTVRWIVEPAQRNRVGELIVEATQAIIADAQQARDSAVWFRASWQETQRRRDGLTIDAQALPAWLAATAKVLPPASQEQADRIWLDNTRDKQVATAAVYGLILARDAADNTQRMEGGRLWQRIQLHGVTRGLAMQPLNQMPERADRERSLRAPGRFGEALKELAQDASWQVLMPFRAGYPTQSARSSPRRHLDEVVIARALT